MHCTLLVERSEVRALLSNQIAEESHGVLHRVANCVILVLLKKKKKKKKISKYLNKYLKVVFNDSKLCVN